MPHDYLSNVKHLVTAVVYVLFLGQAVSSTVVSAQPGSTRPAQAPQGWSEPVPLSNLDPPVNSERPDIAVCADGTVYVVWEQRGEMEQDSEIWYRVYDPSVGWNAASPIFPGPNARGREPAIAVSSDCVLHLVWSKFWQGNYEVFYALNRGDGFETSVNVSRTSLDYDGGSFQPDVVVDSSGEPRVVWVEMVFGGGPQLYEGSPTTSDLPWSKTDVPGGDGQQVQVPALAIDRNDQPHLTWMRQDSRLRLDILYKRPEDWPTVVVENISDSSNASRLPHIAVSGDKVVIVWQETVDGDDEIYATWRKLDSYASFVSASNLSNSDATSRAPAVTVDSAGKFFVAWDEGSPTDAILTRPWPGIGNWWDTEVISNGGTNVKDPAIAASPSDNHVYAVWAQKNGPNDTWDIYFSDMDLAVYKFYLTLIMNRHGP